MNNKSLPPDSREETKYTAFIKANNKKFRLIYTKAEGFNIIRDVLKIEVNNLLEDVIIEIKNLLEEKIYNKIHLYIKYKYFVLLADRIEEVYEILKSTKYKIHFAFVSKKYKEEDYILLYEFNLPHL